MESKCFFAGFGGQGIILMGTILAYAAMIDGKQTLFFPSYAVTMRGGSAHCTVIVSEREIASPIVERPDYGIAMNSAAFDLIEPRVAPGGVLLMNANMSKRGPERDDIRTVLVKAFEAAQSCGEGRMANMVMLGALIRLSGIVSLEAARAGLERAMQPKLRQLIPRNFTALRKGHELVS